jgi:hypothetical protein
MKKVQLKTNTPAKEARKAIMQFYKQIEISAELESVCIAKRQAINVYPSDKLGVADGYGVILGKWDDTLYFDTPHARDSGMVVVDKVENKKMLKKFLKKELKTDDGEGLYIITTSNRNGKLVRECAFMGRGNYTDLLFCDKEKATVARELVIFIDTAKAA